MRITTAARKKKKLAPPNLSQRGIYPFRLGVTPPRKREVVVQSSAGSAVVVLCWFSSRRCLTCQPMNEVGQGRVLVFHPWFHPMALIPDCTGSGGLGGQVKTLLKTKCSLTKSPP